MKVSIIIPARNEEGCLGALLESLAALQFPQEQVECIVVDHESTDGTAELARNAGARVFQKKGGTVSAARNFGASLAEGEILAFLDADCTIAEDWLSRALPYLADPRVGVVGSYYVVPLDSASWVREALHKQTQMRPKFSEGKWIPAGNMLIRREVFQKCGGFDESLTTCEDVDICARIAKEYRVIEDTTIRCLHHGEPRTLWQLFRKELWRGRDNFLGVLRHGLQWREVPSLLLPIYSVATLAAFLLSFLIGAVSTWNPIPSMLWTGILFLIPLLGVAALTSLRSGHLSFVLHFTLLYAVYFIARGLAPFYSWRYV